jgi:hypothetical protein
MRIVPNGSQGANFTTGVREREDANRTREVGDSVWETEDRRRSLLQIRPNNQRIKMMIRIVPKRPCDL